MANAAQSGPETLDDEQQSHFLKMFLYVLGFLVLFTLFCMFVARSIASASAPGSDDTIVRASLMSRITPVGSVRTTADGPVLTATAAPAAPQSAEEIVQGVCSACHLAGVAGAPKIDDDAAWTKLRASGIDTLLASVINGKGSMPARAGNPALTDDELRAAVQHLAGFPVSEGEGNASAETDSDAANSNEDTATSKSVVLEDASGTAMAAGELTERVKGITDGLCVACHLSGVGGAPKIGDKAAWTTRAEKGLEAQVAIVAAGKGAMPARGGSDLSDEELGSAIMYLMSK